MDHQKNGIHDLVKEKYSAIAQGKRGLGASSCCGGPTPLVDIQTLSKTLDYGDDDLLLAPGEANLGLGCGNPIGMADLKQCGRRRGKGGVFSLHSGCKTLTEC